MRHPGPVLRQRGPIGEDRREVEVCEVELEIELNLSQMAQKPVLWGSVGRASVTHIELE